MKILVLAGGLSSERDVSFATGTMVGNALREKGHQVALVDLFCGVEDPLTDLDAFFAAGGSHIDTAITENAPDLKQVKAQRKDQSPSRIGSQVLALCQAADIVFLALHGADGEDGKLQAALDLLGVKYTGSGPVSSAIAMNKSLAKLVFNAHGLKTPQGVILSAGDPVPQIPLPVVVKPCCGGSSVATTYVESQEQMNAALAAVFSLGEKAMVEEYVKGREFSVAILDDQALPVIELDYDGPIFDYVVKYKAGACREICPAPIEDGLAKRLQKMAVEAFQALDLRVYCRMDFIVREDGEIYLLEANTLPGMTANSIVPREAAAAGIDYASLCEKVVQLSLEQYQ